MTREYRPFTTAEDKAIMAPDGPSTDALAASLGRPTRAIYNRRFALKTGTGQDQKAWDQRQDKCILAADRPRDAVLAQQLGRSVQSIQVRRSRIR